MSEEDLRDYESTFSDTDSITDTESEASSVADSCTNSDPYTLEPFTDDPGLIIIKTLNSQGKFIERGECMTREVMNSILESEEESVNSWNSENPVDNTPQNVMALWSSPKDGNVAGFGGQATGKFVFKLPNLMYITLGSLKRVMKERNVQEWFALPLYSGKKRRVGNIYSVFGVSMNHGQLPGYRIYKLFTKEEIRQGVEVKETRDDYPLEIAPNGDYGIELSRMRGADLIVSFYTAIFHTIANYGNDEIDVYI
jgi:hypothetical protein